MTRTKEFPVDLIDAVVDGKALDREEVIALLSLPAHSQEAGLVIAAADSLNRRLSGNVAEVHAQVGLDTSPCTNDCGFCAFSSSGKVFAERSELPVPEVIDRARASLDQGANAIYLMVTGNYDFGRFIEVSTEVRGALSADALMIANVMDFGPAEARRLVGAGFAGVYHALRLREGRDTAIRPEVRLATIRAAREAGLGVGTCVEPVGPEHPPEEIADVMLALREAGPCFSGAMRRIPVPGTRLAHLGMISEWRLAWLVAVTRLAMGLTVPANCTHEPNVLGAASGANLLWAEAGANPRDAADRTETSRGAGVMDCIRMLTEADYVVRKGPSRLFQAEVRRPGGSGPAEQGHGRG